MEDNFSTHLGVLGGIVSGRFKRVILIVPFISNLMPLLIRQEVPISGQEVGDPWSTS